jgi:hypothetical protein
MKKLDPIESEEKYAERCNLQYCLYLRAMKALLDPESPCVIENWFWTSAGSLPAPSLPAFGSCRGVRQHML